MTRTRWAVACWLVATTCVCHCWLVQQCVSAERLRNQHGWASQPWHPTIPVSTGSAEPPSRAEAAAALRRCVTFFDEQVSIEGGYLWRYGADLARREGEGRAEATTAWVQPPGTPSVGLALLRAYETTGEPYLLEAARRSAHALVRGQLHSGGWDYRIEFAAERRRRYAYRVDGPAESKRNVSTLDDNTTQAALTMLMQFDRATEFRDGRVHESVAYGLQRLLAVQYPVGAWPQRFAAPPDAERFPVRSAGYPETWSRTHPRDGYSHFYTLNDNAVADTIVALFDAADIYDEPRYRAAACRGGEFLLRAQMPEPQPAWAQQYNADMHPAWARRFEPPSVTGGESQGVMRTLMLLYERTGERRFLEPIPSALAYLHRSRLSDGRLARFYELKTNRPLYFTRQYELTYDDGDLPTHYAFKVGSSLEAIEHTYRRLAAEPENHRPLAPQQSAPTKPAMTDALAQQARAALDALDHRGAWVADGRLSYHGDDDPTRQIIDTRTFIRNIAALSQFLAASDD